MSLTSYVSLCTGVQALAKTAVIKCRKVVARRGLFRLSTRSICYKSAPLVFNDNDYFGLALSVRVAAYQRSPGYDSMPIYGCPLEIAKLYSRRTIRTFR